MDSGIDIAGLSDDAAFRILAGSSISMILTDPGLPNNPIVYVNPAFERVTGYPAAEALGRNCRFLQGPDTDADDIDRIRHAIAHCRETTVDILNYSKDGSPFVNRLLLTPVYEKTNKLRYFMGIQKRLTDDEARNSVNVNQHALREIKHRVKNHLSMIVSMVRMQARDEAAVPESLRALARRLESLQLLYDQLSGYGVGRRGGNAALDSYVAALAESTADLDARSGIRIEQSLEAVECGSDTAAKLGMILSEVLNNALQHAFPARDEGLVTVSLHRGADDGAFTLVVADDGIGIPPEKAWPNPKSVGGRIVRGLIMDIDAKLDVNTGKDGTRVSLTVPSRN